MPWPPATAPPRCLVEAEMGSFTRSGMSPPLDAGPSGRCPTSVPRSPPVGGATVFTVSACNTSPLGWTGLSVWVVLRGRGDFFTALVCPSCSAVISGVDTPESGYVFLLQVGGGACVTARLWWQSTTGGPCTAPRSTSPLRWTTRGSPSASRTSSPRRGGWTSRRQRWCPPSASPPSPGTTSLRTCRRWLR